MTKPSNKAFFREVAGTCIRLLEASGTTRSFSEIKFNIVGA